MSSVKATAGPLDALWQAGTMAWMLIVGEGVALILALAPGVDRPRLPYFGFLSLVIQWVLICTLVLLYSLRHWLRRLEPRRVAYVAIALLLGCAWALAALMGFFFAETSPPANGEWNGLPWHAAAIALTVGLLGLAALRAHWHYRQSLLRAKQAEVTALQARIQPHFLFNTLNSAAALVHARPNDAEKVLLGMADLFRAAMAPSGWVSLARELDLTREYLDIEQLRFGERLQVIWDVRVDPDAFAIPLLSVQPLAENAVLHGTESDENRKTVRIAVQERDERIVVTIENRISANAAPTLHDGHGVGLAGIRSRLDTVTDGAATLATARTETSFTATLDLPRRAAPHADIR